MLLKAGKDGGAVPGRRTSCWGISSIRPHTLRNISFVVENDAVSGDADNTSCVFESPLCLPSHFFVIIPPFASRGQFHHSKRNPPALVQRALRVPRREEAGQFHIPTASLPFPPTFLCSNSSHLSQPETRRNLHANTRLSPSLSPLLACLTCCPPALCAKHDTVLIQSRNNADRPPLFPQVKQGRNVGR